MRPPFAWAISSSLGEASKVDNSRIRRSCSPQIVSVSRSSQWWAHHDSASSRTLELRVSLFSPVLVGP